MGESVRLTLGGIAAGAIFAFALTRLLSKMLFGVTRLDLATFPGVGPLLTLVALTASYLPGQRAAARRAE